VPDRRRSERGPAQRRAPARQDRCRSSVACPGSETWPRRTRSRVVIARALLTAEVLARPVRRSARAATGVRLSLHFTGEGIGDLARHLLEAVRAQTRSSAASFRRSPAFPAASITRSPTLPAASVSTLRRRPGSPSSWPEAAPEAALGRAQDSRAPDPAARRRCQSTGQEHHPCGSRSPRPGQASFRDCSAGRLTKLRIGTCRRQEVLRRPCWRGRTNPSPRL
jgi:hypothetical protein